MINQKKRVSGTFLLIIINVFAFVAGMVLMTLFGENFFINFIALKPANIFAGQSLWTLITSMFMHAPGLIPFHLIVNMFVLFSLGSFCERILGKKRFILFYLISGLVAGIMFVLLSYFFGNTDFGARIFGSPLTPAVGASGAIFAIAGLFMVLTPKLKFSIIFLPFWRVPAYIMIPVVLFGMWILTASFGAPVGNTAHFGGFLAGVVYAIYLRKKYSKKVTALNRFIR
ncbi:MAG: rhomboid family intramembrane serine protease [archaeon]